jgi:endo-1,4-beta-mannosidase
MVEHVNGTAYDLALEADKAALLESSFLYWSSAVRDAIRNVDNEALVTVGFFAPAPLGTPSNTAIVNSELDFIDLHMYPQTATLSEYDDYFGLMASKDKLIIMGEFGIIGNDYQDADQVKEILLNWKNDAVTKYHIDGWLMWTWNTGLGSELSFPDDDKLIFKALRD